MNSKSRRDKEVLRLLGTYTFLSCVQIEEFVLGESTLNASSRERVTWRILRRLSQRRLIATNALLAGEPDGMPSRIAYFLTSSGRRVFAALESVVPRRRLRVRGTFLLAPALMVAEIALVFLRQARASSGRDLLRWECDMASTPAETDRSPRGLRSGVATRWPADYR
jgi:hypothetical protein